MIVSTFLSRFKIYVNLKYTYKIIIGLVVSATFTQVVVNLYNALTFKFINKIFFISQISFALLLFLSLICFYIALRYINFLDEINELKFSMEKQDNKIEHKDNIIATLRSQKHDYLKHLQVVYSLLNMNRNDDATIYIENISYNFQTKKSRYGKVSYLDSIAALKYEECTSKDIKFDMYVQDFIDNLNISPNDMISVMLNIIDNAIDALSTIDKNNKYIKVSIYEDEFQYVISIKNNGPKIYNLDGIFSEGFSTKDGETRGYGLYLVKNLLDKYNYHIFAESDDYITEFTILIPKYI